MIRILTALYFVTTLCRTQEIHLNVNITQVFIQKISPDILSWNDKERENDFHYIITSMEGPDLPPWLFTKYFKNDNSIFLFGAVPKDIDAERVEFQISITSLYSYRNKYCKLIFSILFIEEFPKYEIHIRINNVNIREMLNIDRRNAFIEIFKEYFWRESKENLYITFLAASEDVGFPLPSNPNDTAGVVLHIGSITDFSVQLINLQNETIPLKKHCPSFYKRITVERFFRPKNFIVDWCFFKLVYLDDCYMQSLSRKNAPSQNCPFISYNASDELLKTEEEFLINKTQVPLSPVYGMIVLLVIIPSLFLGFIIALWLASFMCFNSAKLNDPYSDDYFETIFFICEDFFRIRRFNTRVQSEEESDDPQILFHF